jgi:hypothetical protein
MSYFRTNNAATVGAASTGSLAKAWGILVASGSTGTLRLQKTVLGGTGSFTTMSLAHITPGVAFPCYPSSVEVASGTVYLLA